jgi:hypothetical protein
MRSDLPPQLFEQLLAAASEKVRVKLEAEREYAKSDIDKVVDEVAEKIQTGTATQPISYAAARSGGIDAPGWPADGRQTTGIRCDRSVRRDGCCTLGHVERTDRGHRTKYARYASGIPARLCQGNRPVVGNNTQHMMLAAKRHRRSTVGVDQAMPAFHRLRQSTAQQILDFHRIASCSVRRH